MENRFQVTVQYVDFPMGVSPVYSHRNNLTEEEAKKLAKKLNEEENKKGSGSVYAVYAVNEMK